ncbi:MAG: Gfo/Idh/MocA family oxidoreductase, partial [Armatimonadota bacterium]|nr:Gfo/Idh/MocA family oxidoreductase [Armatimonadota bacterium]
MPSSIYTQHPTPPGDTYQMADKLNIGIIGAGNRGVNGLGALITAHAEARVTALSDPNPERMKAAVGSLSPGMKCYTQVDEMLRSEKLDGLVITSPDYLHAGHVVAALEAGITHILVEKPIATTAEGCTQILESLRTRPAHISIGFNLRHAPLARKIKEVIDAGIIGNLMIMENREFYDGGRT